MQVVVVVFVVDRYVCDLIMKLIYIIEMSVECVFGVLQVG